METFRDSSLGQLVRYLTKDKLLQYPEEQNEKLLANLGSLANFEMVGQAFINRQSIITEEPERKTDPESSEATRQHTPYPSNPPLPRPESTHSSTTTIGNFTVTASQSHVNSQVVSDEHGRTLELLHPLQPARSRYLTEPGRPLLDDQVEAALDAREKIEHNTKTVAWYGEDDRENPLNWSEKKKAYVVFVICLYTWGVYVGSSIYSASESGIQEHFGVRNVIAALGLSLYVLGYGVGPLFFAPLSEIPSLGRNIPYVSSMFIYTMLCIATPQVNSIASLLVLRFLQGLFGSPILATGGASISDMYTDFQTPYAMTFWVVSAYCGPALGPLISGYAIMAENWRWSLWELLWIAIPVFLIVAFLLPETSADTILLRRAQRLRKLTGNLQLKSESEIIQSKMAARTIVYEALIIPLKITVQDPAILFTNIYTSVVYGIFYSFFEAFPIAFMEIHGFSLGSLGVVFSVVVVACTLGLTVYWLYLSLIWEPRVRKHGFGPPETRLIPGLFASFGPPIGLMIFGWTSRVEIHWIVPLIGVTIYCGSVFVLLQCVFTYIPLSYPKYSASLFASNDFIRSAMATGSVLFGRPLYTNLGIGPGISVLAGVTVLCIGGIFLLYTYGEKLRAKSKFAVVE